MRTWAPREGQITKQWFVVDATDMVLGRLASRVATVLKGKHRPEYTPHSDCGDHVIVINASKVRVTGNKEEDKHYYRHSGYPGGLKDVTLAEQRERHPDRIITLAVKGMMPKNPLGRSMMKKLRVYAGADHPHQAQQPTPLEV